MGCDIHAYREVKKDDVWVCIEEWDNSFEDERAYLSDVGISSNYLLFGLLCDSVRTTHNISIKKRGLPADISEQIQSESDSWDCDGHSHSYTTLDELIKLSVDVIIHDVNYVSDSLRKLRESFNEHKDQECRLVFWFDN